MHDVHQHGLCCNGLIDDNELQKCCPRTHQTHVIVRGMRLDMVKCVPMLECLILPPIKSINDEVLQQAPIPSLVTRTGEPIARREPELCILAAPQVH
jgi:hypothetical protein